RSPRWLCAIPESAAPHVPHVATSCAGHQQQREVIAEGFIRLLRERRGENRQLIRLQKAVPLVLAKCRNVCSRILSLPAPLDSLAEIDERSSMFAEYAVMLAVILVIVVGTIRLVGSNANNLFSSVASSVQ